MDCSKTMAVLLWYIMVYFSRVCARPTCDINLTTSTADCSFRMLSKVPSDVPNSIRILKLDFNLFQEVDLKQFTRFQNLEELYLTYNIIKHVSNESSPGLTTLRVLNINGNMLQDWNNLIFSGMSKLQSLSINNNHLEVSLFKGLCKLTFLDMSLNKPISLNSTPFMELNNLEYLDLSGCHIQELRSAMFTGLSNLLVLQLDYNSLQYLHTDLFVELKNLKSLHLGGNPLYFSSSFPADIFQPLAHLKELYLEEIYINVDPPASYTYLDEQLKKILSLKALYIDGVPNKIFGPGFTALINLDTLSIKGNLSEIKNETFVNLRKTSSLTLKLLNCKVSHILPHAFAPLQSLRTLNVSYMSSLCNNEMWYNLTSELRKTNVKTMIAPNLCIGAHFPKKWWYLPELEVLDLSYNGLVFIDFSKLPVSLEEIYFQFNKILGFSALDKQRNLRKLDLSNQNIIYDNNDNRETTTAHLKTGLKEQLNGIYRGTLDQHMLYKATPATLYDTKTSINTDLDKSGQSVELNSGTEQSKYQLPLLRVIPPYLESINVSETTLFCQLCSYDNTNNSIRSLTGSSLQSHPLCRVYRRLGLFWPWLDKLLMLEHLDLSGNQIRTIPIGAFSNQKNLRHLYLSDNSLVTLKFEIKYLSNVKEIYLSRNQIQYATNPFTTDVELYTKHSNLKIHLDGNDLICNCERTRFASWLLTSKAIYNKNDLQCKHENGSWASLQHSAKLLQQLEFGCIYVIVTASCVIGFAFLLLGASCVAFVRYKSRKFKYLTTVGRRNLNPYHPIEECHIEFEYDVYISYERDHDITENETMHAFVTLKLYPWLQRRGFKVLIRDELDIGRKLYEVISKALRKSRKVIVLLSNDYCMDCWNVFEFNTAVMEGIYTKRHVVIPVAFESLMCGEFHEEIVSFLKPEPVPRYNIEDDFTVLAKYLSDQVGW